MRRISTGKYKKRLWIILFALCFVFSTVLSIMLVFSSIDERRASADTAVKTILSNEYQVLSDELMAAFYSMVYISQSEAVLAMNLNNGNVTNDVYYDTIKSQAEITKFNSLYAMPSGSRISAFYITDNTKIAFDGISSMDLEVYSERIGQTRDNLNKIFYDLKSDYLNTSTTKVVTIDEQRVLQYYLRVGDTQSRMVLLLQIPESAFLNSFNLETSEHKDVFWAISNGEEVLLSDGVEANFDEMLGLINSAKPNITHELSEIYNDYTTTIMAGELETLPLDFAVSFTADVSLSVEDMAFFVAVFLLFIVFALIISLAFSKIMYNPVLNTLKLLGIDTYASSSDEFLQIANTHKQTQLTVEELNYQLRYQHILLQSQQLSTFMFHAHTPAEDSKLDIGKNYLLALFTYLTQSFSRANYLKSKSAIESDIVKNEKDVFFVDVSFSSFAIIFKDKTHAEAVDYLTEKVNSLPEDCECSLKIAISTQSGALNTLNSQYLECINILEFKNRFSENLFLTKDMLPDDLSQMFSYTFKEEQTIIQLACAANKEALFHLKRVLTENLMNKTLIASEYQHFFFALLSTYQRIIYTSQINVDLPRYENITSAKNKNDFDDLSLVLAEKLEEIIKAISKSQTEKNVDTDKKIENYIALNYNRDISLDDLASELNMSSKYCSSLFKKSTGVTFKKQLNTHRIEIAKSILRENPKTKISELASMVGYTSANTFIQVFKQYTGSTPAKYAADSGIVDDEII